MYHNTGCGNRSYCAGIHISNHTFLQGCEGVECSLMQHVDILGVIGGVIGAVTVQVAKQTKTGD